MTSILDVVKEFDKKKSSMYIPLKDKDIQDIFKKYHESNSINDISNEYNISINNVSKLLHQLTNFALPILEKIYIDYLVNKIRKQENVVKVQIFGEIFSPDIITYYNNLDIDIFRIITVYSNRKYFYIDTKKYIYEIILVNYMQDSIFSDVKVNYYFHIINFNDNICSEIKINYKNIILNFDRDLIKQIKSIIEKSRQFIKLHYG